MTAALLGRVETGVERAECKRFRLPIGNETGLLGFVICRSVLWEKRKKRELRASRMTAWSSNGKGFERSAAVLD